MATELDQSRLCEECGYSLTGLSGESRCPECGAEFNLDFPAQARIPWIQREKLGSANAFVRTVFMILFSPTKFATEICRTRRVNMHAAVEFGELCMRIVGIGIAALAWVTACILILAEAYRERKSLGLRSCF